MIIVDDGSSDGSQREIQGWLSEQPKITFLALPENLGNTKAFNKGLVKAKGKYIIDLSCDDLLLPDRIAQQVTFFESQSNKVGVIYSDAQYINEEGKNLSIHFDNKKMIPFSGDVFDRVIDTYFIPPPTMMMRKTVFDALNGYDENLAYEDFDFWIRSAKSWHYAFQDKVLTKMRKVSGSHNTTLYQKNDEKLASTLIICHKIKELATASSTKTALIKRLNYEIRHAFLNGNTKELIGFTDLLKELSGLSLIQYAMITASRWGLSLK